MTKKLRSQKKTSKDHLCYDVLIIGSGVTGMAAGMYAGRLGLRTLVLGSTSSNELPIGGVITLTTTVENYPGYKHLTGEELANKIRDHALEYDTVSIQEGHVDTITKKKKYFEAITKDKSYRAFTLIFATGTKWKKLLIKGAERFENKGVHYCALCDGPVYKNKIVAVIGGGDGAAKEALLLAQHAKTVYLIVRSTLKAEPINDKLVKNHKKITVLNSTNVVDIRGKKFVEEITLDNTHKGKKKLKLNGIFGAIGHIPLSTLAKTLGVKTNKHKEIIINRSANTNIPGVYAAGDVVDSGFKQAITGVAEGVHAAHSAYAYTQGHAIEFSGYCKHETGKKGRNVTSKKRTKKKKA